MGVEAVVVVVVVDVTTDGTEGVASQATTVYRARSCRPPHGEDRRAGRVDARASLWHRSAAR